MGRRVLQHALRNPDQLYLEIIALLLFKLHHFLLFPLYIFFHLVPRLPPFIRHLIPHLVTLLLRLVLLLLISVLLTFTFFLFPLQLGKHMRPFLFFLKLLLVSLLFEGCLLSVLFGLGLGELWERLLGRVEGRHVLHVDFLDQIFDLIRLLDDSVGF